MLTRRWSAAAFFAVMLAALWILLMGSPVLAQDAGNNNLVQPNEMVQQPKASVTAKPEAPTPAPDEAPVTETVATDKPPASDPPEQVSPAPKSAEPTSPAAPEPEEQAEQNQPSQKPPVQQVPVQQLPARDMAPAPQTEESQATAKPVATAKATKATQTKKPASKASVTKAAKTSATKAARNIGMAQAVAKDDVPKGSPVGVQLAVIAVLLVLGVGYFRLMSHSGRRAPAVKVEVAGSENGKQSDGV